MHVYFLVLAVVQQAHTVEYRHICLYAVAKSAPIYRVRLYTTCNFNYFFIQPTPEIYYLYKSFSALILLTQSHFRSQNFNCTVFYRANLN